MTTAKCRPQGPEGGRLGPAHRTMSQRPWPIRPAQPGRARRGCGQWRPGRSAGRAVIAHVLLQSGVLGAG
eukprot:5405457-Lingulodinium_polyedra.AAC.1